MQKILSARLDEAVLEELDRVTAARKMTKKAFLEQAIRRLAKDLGSDGESDIWSESCGTWARNEAPERTIERGRRAFQDALERLQKGHRARLHR